MPQLMKTQPLQDSKNGHGNEEPSLRVIYTGRGGQDDAPKWADQATPPCVAEVSHEPTLGLRYDTGESKYVQTIV